MKKVVRLTESDLKNIILETVNEIRKANSRLKLHMGIGWEENYRHPNAKNGVLYYIWFSIGFSEAWNNSIAGWDCVSLEELYNASEIKVNVSLDNLEDDEIRDVIKELNCGEKVNKWAYEDEPHKVFHEVMGDIKPFIMRHVKEAYREFMNDPMTRDWEKKKAKEFFGKKLHESYPTYTQIRNVTGIEDDDELNAAVECERREALEDKIIGEFFGGLRNPNVFVFDKVCAALADKFGFKYVGHDDDREEHMFSNGTDVLHLFPKTYYPQQGSFRLSNAYISGR